MAKIVDNVTSFSMPNDLVVCAQKILDVIIEDTEANNQKSHVSDVIMTGGGLTSIYDIWQEGIEQAAKHAKVKTEMMGISLPSHGYPTYVLKINDMCTCLASTSHNWEYSLNARENKDIVDDLYAYFNNAMFFDITTKKIHSISKYNSKYAGRRCVVCCHITDGHYVINQEKDHLCPQCHAGELILVSKDIVVTHPTDSKAKGTEDKKEDVVKSDKKIIHDYLVKKDKKFTVMEEVELHGITWILGKNWQKELKCRECNADSSHIDFFMLPPSRMPEKDMSESIAKCECDVCKCCFYLVKSPNKKQTAGSLS